MSYFNTLNQYVDNAREAEGHLDDYRNALVSSKVADVKDKFDQYINNVESFGQATLGTAGAYHMGRKIYKKVKEKYGKDPSKKEKEEDEKKEEGEEGEEVPESSANSTEFENPTFTQDTLPEDSPSVATSSEAPSGVPNEEEQASAQNDTSATNAGEEFEGAEDVEPADMLGAGKDLLARAKAVRSGEVDPALGEDAGDLRAGAQGIFESLLNPTTTRPDPAPEPTGADAPASTNTHVGEAPEPAVAEPDTVAPRPSATADASEASADADSFEAVSSASRQAIKNAGENAAKDFAEKAGAKIGEKVAFDAVGVAADAVPILGEVAGLYQIFHGLFKEHKERAQEYKEEDATAAGVRSGGGVAVGGVDVGAVTSQAGNLMGLV